MAERLGGTGKSSSSVVAQATELWSLVRGYALQETVGPLRGAGRYVGYGVAGALLVGAGLSLVALALLRFLQTETGDALDGHLSFVPYVIVLVACLVVIGVMLSRMGRRDGGDSRG